MSCCDELVTWVQRGDITERDYVLRVLTRTDEDDLADMDEMY